MIGTAYRKNVLTVVDTSGKDLAAALGKNPYLIKPNKAELEEIQNTRLDSIQKITSAARELQNRGARNVLVSLGSDGALLAADDGYAYFCRIPEGQLIDSTGAGDSMVAGFVAKDLTGASKAECLQFAVACGSASAYSYGLLERKDLEQICLRMPEPEMIS